MKIEMDLTRADMSSTKCSCSQASSCPGTHDETESGSGDGNGCSSIDFFHLHHSDFLRPSVRNSTLVWARRTVWAVIPAQVVTLLETLESLEESIQLLARNRVVISLRL